MTFFPSMFFGFGVFCFLISSESGWADSKPAFGAIRPDRVHEVRTQKKNDYINDGVVAGGEARVETSVLHEVRRATHEDYERIVFELMGSQEGELIPLEASPAYQVSLSPTMGRMAVTFFGEVHLGFEGEEVQQAFEQSEAVEKVDLLPPVQEDRWTVVFYLHEGRPIEVVQLSDPIRLMIDLAHPASGIN